MAGREVLKRMKKGATPKSRSKVETSTRIRTGKVVSPKTSEDSLHDMSSRTPKSRSSNTVRISARTPTVATVGRTRSPRSSSSLSQRNAGMSPISSSASPLFSPKSPHSRSNDSTLLQLQLENELLMTRAEAAERRSELLSTEVDRLNDCMLQTQRACEEAQVQVEQLRKQEAEARNELDNLDREYRDCAYHLKSLTEKNADLIKALQEESRTRAKIEAASKRLAAENETLRSRADKLNIEVARESTERKSSTSIVKDLQKETERLREELNSVRIDHKLLLEKKASGELQLQERIQSLDSQSRSYQDELAACKQRLAAIEHEGIEKDRANRELKTMLHEQGEKLKAVQDQVTINNDYTEKLEEEVKKKQERLSTAAERQNEKRLQLKIKHLEELGQSGENHVKEVVKRMDNEISQLRSELGKEQAESSRLTERLIHFERKAEDADRVIAELEKEVAAVWDAKERGSKSLLSNQDALLALQQEVLKENRSIMFELRTLEERNASLLKMLGGEEERATESEKQIDVIRRENSELSSTLSLKEKEISDMSRTLTEAQGELAKVSMRMQAEANEAARLKTEVEALQYKVVRGSFLLCPRPSHPRTSVTP
ncbi:hypothetical protein GUITHDRAFT_132497 [Guillardia theta CCMP2712]|uniref:Uncharacterized protein n=1 Tax=Guillardia theta (strain CCMP2712) TaxID=905079 RepID=L1K0W4_GUITC|nr:hypothetical protein GUITHDRAFT_132497 [Guillardia theta CCMP2712]EKX54095.1 hypothetical protein GUITHDRAFT_132497 [Guillardia theta CCMP2712]|eukprot:XP_005841075.1 hypothetical protein GUITHDRAFT_132497 [Guillardia theta CCMP2712]